MKTILTFALFLMSSHAFAAQVGFSCDDESDINFFKYYLVDLDTDAKTVKLTYEYIYGGSPRYGKWEINQEQLEKVYSEGENGYGWRHALTYSPKVFLSRMDPSDSMVHIDGSWRKFDCQMIPREIIALKLEQLEDAKKERQSRNKF